MAEMVYIQNIKSRSKIRKLLGIVLRYKNHLKFSFFRYVARKKGAQIGENVNLNWALVKRINSNLSVGNNSSIQSSKLDLRSKISIGNNVIIGSNVEIITCSHNINSKEWEFKSYGIKIYDYVWIATNVLILPACRLIGEGAVCGAGSVVVNDIESMAVVGGNPAKKIKQRSEVHSNLIVESLLGGDFKRFLKVCIDAK